MYALQPDERYEVGVSAGRIRRFTATPYSFALHTTAERAQRSQNIPCIKLAYAA